MGMIKSESGVAQTYATNLRKAGQELSGIAGVEQDDQTTLEGNARAPTVLGQSKTLLNKIVSAVDTASHHLHSVASEFEAIDEAGAKSFKGK